MNGPIRPSSAVRCLRVVASALAIVVVGAGVIVTAPRAHAQDPTGVEQVVSWDVDVTIGADGVVRFDETLVYDFGAATDRHGIYRDIVTRQRYDDTHDRRYPFTLLAVTADGQPVPVAEQHTGSDPSDAGFVRLRIGDPDRFVSGRVTYAISYELEATLNAFETHAELYWNVVDLTTSSVLAAAQTVRVRAPAAVTRAACFAGPVGSGLACASAEVVDGEARFTNQQLFPGDVLSVVVAVPPGAVTVQPPILEERWSLDRAFERTPATVGGSVALLVAGGLGLGALVWRRGRDRQAVGSAVDAAFPEAGARTEPVPLGHDVVTPVEFLPPDGLRPGLVGTIIDEEVNPVDVSATLVDLAVRGYLRIEELEKKFLRRQDYRLVQLAEPDAELLEYERRLLARVFENRTEIDLSDLRGSFADDYKAVRNALYAEAVRRRWFDRRPDRTRDRWTGLGVALIVAGVAGGVALAVFTHWALLAIPVVVLGLAVVVVGRTAMPRRTARGTAALRRCLGFREFIVNSEVHRARFAEEKHLFTEYLPYAVVFGATERWARTFADLGVDTAAATAGWYVGRGGFDVGSFSESVNSFADATGSALTVTPASSGSSGFSGGGGFAGGGGGGGGVGSW